MTDKPFQPLLAATMKDADISKVRFPMLWSPKLDGIRTLIHPNGPVTRKIKLVPNDKLREALSDPLLSGMDGEMIYGPITAPEVFNHTQSMVMRVAGPCPYEADGKYLVFDDFTYPGISFTRRFSGLSKRVATLPLRLRELVQLVPHKVADNADDLMNIEAVIVGQGFEGIMGRDPNGLYKFGRSTMNEGTLFKIKRFKDDEASIVGVEELMHNDNEKLRDELGHAKRSSHQENKRPAGTLGALVLYDKKYEGIQVGNKLTDGTFKLGTGFTSAERDRLWRMNLAGTLLGQTAAFKYQPSGMKDLPRFPSYKGLRHD